MDIGFAGEAYESFQRIVASLSGYTVGLFTPGKPVEVVQLVGPDLDAEMGDVVRYRELDDDQNPVGDVKSATALRIFVY